VSAAPLLLLFDIDGTLLQRSAAEHSRALREAAAGVFGLAALDGVVETAGRTDGAIVRDLAVGAGVDAAEFDARWDEVRAAAVERFASLCPDDLSDRVAPGVVELLTALVGRPREGAAVRESAATPNRTGGWARPAPSAVAPDRPSAYQLSLVTGNLEPVARLKLARAGLGAWFPEGQGGFGSDHRSRAELPAIARRRAGGWPRERTVVIGDTPRDIACARADGVRVAAVATGPFAVEALADADAVVDDARSLLPVLEDFRSNSRAGS
jgi:phosphoglycolate phosphatase-like HAD superfamily hydrolase